MELLNQFTKLFVLDIRNTMGLLFWGNFTLAILVFTFRYTLDNKEPRKKLLIFGLSKTFLALAWLAFFLRKDITSFDAFKFIITNTLVFAGYYLESIAMLMIVKNQTKKAFHTQLVLFIVNLVAFYTTVALEAPSNIRVSVASLNILLITIIPTWRFLTEINGGLFKRILGFNYGILLLVIIFRIIYPLFNTTTSLYSVDATQKIIFLIIFIMMNISGVGYLLLLQEEKERQVKKLLDDQNQFFSIIAHDLKGPFNGIIGLSELLLEKDNNLDSEETNKFIELIHQSSKNTFSLLDNLLTWAQSQTGSLGFNPKKIEASSIIDKSIHLLSNVAKSKNITIQSEIEKDLYLFADTNMLETIFRNLIANALKFTNNNGKVLISSKKEHNQTLFIVEDNGTGITSDKIANLFTSNQKETTLGTNNESGTGLGLMLCKDFVEKHGGKIWVNSKLGEGSSFVFSIPDHD